MFKVRSKNVTYTDDVIEAEYVYPSTRVNKDEDTGEFIVTPTTDTYHFQTMRKIPKLGVMIVGLGGNNGTTVMGGILANKHNITWADKDGVHKPNFYGSVTQCGTVQLGFAGDYGVGEEAWATLKDFIPMVDPKDVVVGGWDINVATMDVAAARNKVLPYDLQMKLKPYWESFQPLPGVYYPDFIAANQETRADNILDPKMTRFEHVEKIREDIRKFKEENGLDSVIVIWSANTERYSKILEGVHDTSENLMRAIKENHTEISQSAVYCVASLLEGCSYINGSPQNTFVPGIVEMSKTLDVYIAGNDFKSGQTKLKSVLVDFLVSAGIRPEAIVSYNHLGNNDGLNLDSEAQFKSKEISKKGVVDDMVMSNKVLFPAEEGAEAHPDHVVVIKYVPFVGDSKRAMDEYSSSIFLDGKNTIVIHNTCEDSLLAAPLIIDLFVMTELMQRVRVCKVEPVEEEEEGEAAPAASSAAASSGSKVKSWKRLHHVLSILGYWLKAPFTPDDTPIINALFRQRHCVENFLRALVGLPANANMLLEQKLGPF